MNKYNEEAESLARAMTAAIIIPIIVVSVVVSAGGMALFVYALLKVGGMIA